MATNKIITELNPTNYAGKFAEGQFNADQNRKLSNINANNPTLGSFDAYRMGEGQFNYNFHLSDPTKVAELATWAVGLVTGIQSELDAQE